MKKIRIFGVLNHIGNQYEMLKLTKNYPVKFSYLENNVRRWSRYSPRPEPQTWLDEDQFEWVQHYEPGKYDLAILHLDQQAADPRIGKGQLYRQLNEVITDIPKIVINHGTPMWDEMFSEEMVIDGGKYLDRKGNEQQIDGIRKIVGDNFMICNSYEAVKRWGWGFPLIHGIDPDDWWDLPKEPRSIIQLSPAGLDKYYNRQLLTYIKTSTKEKTGQFPLHIPLDFVPKDWDEQREILGTSLIYIGQTWDSPMPRSRTEAMLSGCTILTSPYHDADLFIEHGKNGFIMPDNPLSYAEAIYHLINHNYREAVEIGQNAKETAKKYFAPARYQADLWHIITEVVNGRRPEWDGNTIYGKKIEWNGERVKAGGKNEIF